MCVNGDDVTEKNKLIVHSWLYCGKKYFFLAVMAGSEIPFSKKLIPFENKSAGSYIIRVSHERYFRTDFIFSKRDETV